MDDSEAVALLYVQQYLFEHGYNEALSALERKVGLKFDDTKLSESSNLLRLVWKEMEESTFGQIDEEALARKKEDEALLKENIDNFPNTVAHSIVGHHTSNIICVRIWPGQEKILTGSGEGSLQLFTFNNEEVWKTSLGAGAVLNIAFHPRVRENDVRVVAASMGGCVSIVDGNNGALLASHRCHTKYVVRAIWLPGKEDFTDYIGSGSYDQTVAIYGVSSQKGTPITEIKRVTFDSVVQDICLLPDYRHIAVATRDSNYLRFVALNGNEEMEAANINENGDDYVSFYGTHLAVSPCGHYLLVCTEGPRLVILRIKDWTHLRCMYGLFIEKFHQPAATWHSNCCFIFAAAAGGQVYVFHVASGKIVAKLKEHEGNVRNLDFQSCLLASCSFDKTVKILSKSYKFPTR